MVTAQSGPILTHIGACELTTGPDDELVLGHWELSNCTDYNKAIKEAGGLTNLSVWSSFTDPDGQYGHPFVFTMWGEKHSDEPLPVAAAGGTPDERWSTGGLCQLTHAVFVKAVEMSTVAEPNPSVLEALYSRCYFYLDDGAPLDVYAILAAFRDVAEAAQQLVDQAWATGNGNAMESDGSTFEVLAMAIGALLERK